MIQNQRVIWDDNGTNTDLSVDLNEFGSSSVTLPIVAADDYLIIASGLPFNSRFIDISTSNDQASITSVSIWDGQAWQSAVDVIDRTAVAGATFATSGIIEWKTDREEVWNCEQDSEDVEDVDLVGLYNMYWLRMSFSGDFNVATAVKYVGHKFSTDAKLYLRYPDFNRSSLKTAFESGKATWQDQHILAAEEIIEDLKRSNIIISASQILSHELFETAAIHKVAEIIYRGLGKAYDEDRVTARKYYKEALDLRRFHIDMDKDGNLSTGERFRDRTRFTTR